jgi:hypothetical protein
MSNHGHDLIAGLDFPDLRPEIREELHHAWRVARDEALLAYREWCAASAGHLDSAYFTYLAAADREQAAAHHLRLNVEAGTPWERAHRAGLSLLSAFVHRDSTRR